MTNRPASETSALFAFIVVPALIAIATALHGCASSVRDLTVETPDGLKATMHARDVFSTTEVFLKASKTATGWKLEYGRKADPDEESIKAAGGVAADVAGAVVREAIKTAAKAVVP